MCSKPLIYKHILEVTYENGGSFYRNQESNYPYLLSTKLCSKQFLQSLSLKKNIQNTLNGTTHFYNCLKTPTRKLKV